MRPSPPSTSRDERVDRREELRPRRLASLASRAAWSLAFLPPVLAVAVAVGVAAVKRTGSAHAAILAGTPTLWIATVALGT